MALLAGLTLWIGTGLVLSELRWFARRPLADRLRPYVPGAPASSGRPGLLSFESFRDVVGPMSRNLGERLSHLFGVSEELALRLERIHAPHDVTTFRIRQLGAALAALVVAGVVALASRPPLVVAVLVLVGSPLLAFLVIEQQMAGRSAAWQRRVFLELPVVAEQLAMLLSSGFSLGAALNRLAVRGKGACAEDLRRVVSRIRQGLTEVEALREWAATVHVAALDRLIPVLALNSEAADLGRLISEEARSIRRDVQRELVETMERRSQSVWIPVTVATLIPGVILLAIPFTQALKLFSTG
jgi:Flp pilus assembly protein TadB